MSSRNEGADQLQISVVIPVFNGENFVRDALDSVLSQKGADYEVIVVDDGSTDQTPSILAQYDDSIIVHRQVNSGEGAARNAAIPLMRGDYVYFLDADDLIPAEFLRRFAAAATNAPDVDVFHCGWRAETFESKALYAQDEPYPLDADPFHQLFCWGSPAIGSILVRKSTLVQVGGFNPTLRVQADFDFCLRLAAMGARFRGVSGNVAVVRRRADSISSVRRGELAETALDVAEQHLRGHERCPACPPVLATLRIYRHRALLAKSQRLAQRLGLRGQVGRWICAGILIARWPRFGQAALSELASRWRGSQVGGTRERA